MKDEISRDMSAAAHTRPILAVDDDATSLFLIEQQLIDLGYEPVCATSGAEALSALRRDPDRFGAVILDRMMPEMDGIEVARELRIDGLSDLIQIIMLSGADSQEEVRDGLDAGVFYYLTKPTKAGLLKSVLAAALKQGARNRAFAGDAIDPRSLGALDAAQFRFRTLEEADALTSLIAKIFPDPERAATGVGALLVNAVEHGLAKIGFEKKGELLAAGELAAEVERRLSAPDCADRFATAKIARKENGVYLVVTDPGEGFAWRAYLTPDQSRAASSHGRGVAQANVRSFDRLAYNEAGNQAVAFASPAASIEW